MKPHEKPQEKAKESTKEMIKSRQPFIQLFIHQTQKISFKIDFPMYENLHKTIFYYIVDIFFSNQENQ